MSRLVVVSNRVGPLSDEGKAGGLAVGLAGEAVGPLAGLVGTGVAPGAAGLQATAASATTAVMMSAGIDTVRMCSGPVG